MENGLLYTHILSGAVALCSMWVPLISVKGNVNHKKWGKFFVYAMTVVAITALVLSLIRFLKNTESDDQRTFSVFLFYISILSGISVFYGVRTVKIKNKKYGILDYGACLFLAVASLMMIGYGFFKESNLLTYFPIAGLLSAYGPAKFLFFKKGGQKEWWTEHMNGMVGAAIAALTAFLVFGVPRLLNLGPTSIFLWLGPTLIFTPLLMYWTRYYRKRFGV